ncbi:TetR/AcrR family transcriptional regulator [Streptomyces boluensis]|uniref:TetR family transcriptional regulator n=1 Tax=Streptomyces boluensis TaxID=1775135 RepID=A0A964UVG1_9ACTN|nr:TetR/AcrR family transcriptional regulator [Streptomyces boluensis]NBE56163.1 TetR family transcriptional regulator [Streptomyces boluensis]
MAHVTAAERRPQLIKAAIALMAREGVAAGSTRAIAAELGVAQATVHYTFGTKEDLYRAVMAKLTDDLVRQVKGSAPVDAGFEETVAAMTAALWRTVRERPADHQLLNELSMLALRTPKLREVLDSHYREVVAVTSGLVSEAAERTGRELAVPAATVARFFLATFEGLTLQHLTLPDERAELPALQALVGGVVALADGTLKPVPLPGLAP